MFRMIGLSLACAGRQASVRETQRTSQNFRSSVSLRIPCEVLVCRKQERLQEMFSVLD